MTNKVYPPIYIVGPTGSGKSELALRIAKAVDSVIISADSMQIYKGLDIGTAKVSKDIRDKVEHKLIDIVNYDEEFSVAQFAEIARMEIDKAQNAGKLPIIVGGTGLYFEALLYPMSFANTNKNSELREKLQAEYAEVGAQALHDKLRAFDEKTANRLHPNDVKRVIRALEIIMTTGKTLDESSDERKSPNVIMVGFDCERQKLYDRINDRVDEMFAAGLVDEVLSVGSFDCQSMQAIGYKEFKNCDYTTIDGHHVLKIEEEKRIKELIKQHTRNYAKRQLTWFRRYDFINWFEVGDYDGAIEYVLSKISQ
ncbi:MAG: tRNA (adenosine(37)-N6)-dimethylallyltransferase MiaA [Clostridia bacterium]|nr:tRNA (adenosine(37)-N6)-dimethylallyltransferase MiaA [Clostridia bacterium]